MLVFISAGEASADAYGAALAEELSRLLPGSQWTAAEWPYVKILARQLGRVNLSPFERLDGNGESDSLDIVEYVMAFEDELLLEFDESTVPEIHTVRDLIAFVAKNSSLTKERPPSLHLRGIGGSKMLSAGVKLIQNSSEWGVISIFQVLRKLPTLWLGYRAAKRFLAEAGYQEKEGQPTKALPKLFVPIDFGYMNIRLARYAKQHGWKVLYFVPPGSWRRDKQGHDLPEVADAIVTPFSWSAEMLNQMGADAHWFGHPIKQILRGTRDEVRGSRLAVLPGSRKHEIEENLPLIAKAIRQEDQLEFALAPTVNPKHFQRDWQKLTGRTKDVLTVANTAGVLKRARAAIVCSGTATLEAALCRCPMVVVYRLSKGMQVEVKLLRIKRPKYVALPNILLDRLVVPELIQEDATPENLRNELAKVQQDTPERKRQLQDFEELDQVLGSSNAITETARLALRLLTDRSAAP